MRVEIIKLKRRLKRKFHIRKRITGTPERLRLTIFKSLGQIYAQIINDVEKKTIVSCSTIDKEVKTMLKPEMTKTAKSAIVGEVVAKRALQNNITKVAFDRNGYIYHGRVKALADGARKGGLEF
jgi:large subunit ribosomal protein L18